MECLVNVIGNNVIKSNYLIKWNNNLINVIYNGWLSDKMKY